MQTMQFNPIRMLRLLLVSVCTFLIMGPAMAIEEPEYEVMQRAAPFEVRHYRPFIVAETMVDGDMDAASNVGFRRIAGYIFGDNRSVVGAVSPGPQGSANAGSEKIAMTAPVTMEPQEGSASQAMAANRWRVHFVLPKSLTMNTVPRPNNAQVNLREVPAKRYAVLSFSGFAGSEKVQSKSAELLAWISAQGFTPVGAPQLARYDPPWQLPFFRRNEILVELSGL